MADALTAPAAVGPNAARWAGYAAAAVALAVGVLTLNHFLVGVFYDDGLYAGLAWALAHGLGYVHPNLPGAPSAVHYPPLFPMLLAPFFRVLPIAAAGLAGKVASAACFTVASGLVAWHAARTRLLGDAAPVWLVGGVVVAATIAIPVLTLLGVLFSEPLFALFLAGAVIVADRPPVRWSPVLAALAAGGLAALALLTRSIGIAAAGGVLLFAWRARAPLPRLALTALPVFVAGAAWGVWVLIHKRGIDPALAGDYGSYFETVGQAGLGALGSSTTDLARPFGVLTLGWVPSRAAYLAFGIPALLVGIYGLALLTRRSAVGWTLVFYLAILGLWPFPPDRFLWAVLPWLGLAWAAGAADLWQRATRWFRVPLAILVLALSTGYVRYEVKGFTGHWWDLAARRISDNFTELLPALDSLPPGTVLATDNEPLVWLAIQKPAVPFYLFAYQGRQLLEPPPAYQRAYLERAGVTHVLISGRSGSAPQLDRLMGAYPGWLVPVRQWSGGRTLFAVHR